MFIFVKIINEFLKVTNIIYLSDFNITPTTSSLPNYFIRYLYLI